MKSCTIGMPQEQRPFKSNVEIYKIGGQLYQSDNYPSLNHAMVDHAVYSLGAFDCDGYAAHNIIDAMCTVAYVLGSDNTNLRGDLVVNERYIFEDVPLDDFGLCISSLIEGKHI